MKSKLLVRFILFVMCSIGALIFVLFRTPITEASEMSILSLAPGINFLPPETYSTTVTVSWTAVTSDAGISQYYIQQSTDSNFEWDVTTSVVDGNTLSYTFTGLSYNNLYYFRVYAKSLDGNPFNMDPYDPVSNPNGVRWSAITRTKCLPLPANNYSPPAISGISNSTFNTQDGFYYTCDRNPTISWTTPNDWPLPTPTPLPTKMAAGISHSIVLKSDGTVWAWGRNNYGQLGNGTTADSNYPVKVKLGDGTPLTNITYIAAGANFSIALKNDGSVWTWGYNNYYQLGNGTTINSSNPVQVPGLTSIIAIATGDSHSIALKNDGTVWVWGYNNNYQLGDNTNITKQTPVMLTTLSNITAIAAGSFHTLALQSDGTVWIWGYNNNYQIGDGTTTTRKTPYKLTTLSSINAITAGASHSIALQNDGSVWAWGSNSNGQIGNGSGGSGVYQKTPAKLTTVSNITAIAAGANHTIALKNDGTILTWGSNSNGQIGNGSTTDQKTPYQVKLNNGNTLLNINSIVAGNNITIAFKSDNTIWTWGQNNYGQLGDGSRVQKLYPVQVIFITYGVAAGYSYSMSLKNDGSIWSWGSNDGSLGDGTSIRRNIPGQVKLADGDVLTSIIAIAGGGNHTIALKSDGTVCSWGNNYNGQLGNGTSGSGSNQKNPVQVKLTDGTLLSNIVSIAGGGLHTIALKSDGTVWTWGYNSYGELGDGTTTDCKNPVQVKLANGTALTNIIAIAGGDYHTVALKSDGTVWTWGYNSYGGLGDGTTTNRKNPVQVKLASGTALTNIIAIAGGGDHTVALKSDGTVWNWGYNYYGQLCDGTTTDRKNPVQLKLADSTALTNIIAIAGGGNHTVALKSDGTVWTWGYNYYGQLGDGTTTERKNPVQVKLVSGPVLGNIIAIEGGGSYTIVLKNDDTVWTWGSNDWGQLGDATNIDKSYPTRVLPIPNQIRITQYSDQPKKYTEYKPIYLDPSITTSTPTNWNLPDGKYIINVGITVNDSVVWSPSLKLEVIIPPPPIQVNSITCQSTIINDKPNFQTTITIAPVTGATLYKFYRRKNGGLPECLTPTGTMNTTFVDMSLIAHDGIYEYGYSTYHSIGFESDIKWGNEQTICTPDDLAPMVYVPNIAPHPNSVGPPSIMLDTNITFNLGSAKDQEGDQLQYMLYTKELETDPWILNQIWIPTINNQTETVIFLDQHHYQWYLSCIETADIRDKKEIIVIPSSSLYINAHYLLIHCANVFEESESTFQGTKGQPLSFQVECSPIAHFQTFTWDFRDGTPIQSGQQTTHIFHQLSDPDHPYEVVLTATDDQGVQYQGFAKIKIINTSKGQLYADENWAGNHIVEGDIIVPEGKTLTIEPGARILINPNSEIRIFGNLQIAGAGITFDVQNSGVWKGIRFDGLGSGAISDATILHAERGIAGTGSGQIVLTNVTFDRNITGLHCFDGNITVNGCKFLNSQIYGIKEDHGCNPIVTNCIFQNNVINYYDQNLYKLTLLQLNVAPNIGNEYQ